MRDKEKKVNYSNQNLKKYRNIIPFRDMLISEYGFSSNTISSYISDTYQYAEYFYNNQSLANNNEIKPSNNWYKIEEKNVVNYFHECIKKYDTNTVRRKIASLKKFYLFLFSERFIQKNPMESVTLPPKKRNIPRSVSENSIDQMINVTDFLIEEKYIKRSIAMIEILYSTGIRVSELIQLKLSQICTYDYNKNYKIKDHIIILGKRNKERYVTLNESSIDAIKNYLDIRNFSNSDNKIDWLFPSTKKDGSITYISRQRCFQIFKELAKLAGLPLEKISPHKIRHSFATHMIKNGAQIQVIQKILGHEDITSTQIYTSIKTKELKTILETKHPLSVKYKS